MKTNIKNQYIGNYKYTDKDLEQNHFSLTATGLCSI